MTLTTEDLGAVPDVNAATLDELLVSDAFGKFAILSASDEEFIQAGNEWEPGEACATFMQARGSDPWVLEYRERGQQFRADGQVTLEQVRQAFQSYLARGSEWYTALAWSEVPL
ncbi:hypothetical protein Val02_78410 [Virgisporangium aliadipatigenens]|uniref:Uncharacterized protein n=2 Tax=Virgisporangium aliadipatigenens TaxID=741659 RepID=A0A8J3YW50_9ACTN|nr:hypothetical protein Val02_78410 [Virgisporangium aliadipatigenens]